MPIRAIVNTARSLSYYLRLQEVTANNLANVNSDAFKADRMTARQMPGSAFPVAVEQTDLQQGSLRSTERPFDLALEGKGFMTVRTPQGERLTRGGSLHLDPSAALVNADGDPVLGEDGQPLLVTGSKFEVEGDGTVLSDGAGVGRIRLVDVPDPTTLMKEGHGRFLASGAVTPVDDGMLRVRQGMVEDSNLESMQSIVDLITIQRAYAANIDALKAMDSVLGTITGQVGRVGQ